ncbi:MAG: hypothetical protein LIO95_04380, partial [Clostridiales bacterium]|nr:hypothetical protein [Clostridiales bacterium]
PAPPGRRPAATTRRHRLNRGPSRPSRARGATATTYKGNYITGYGGSFQLGGDPALLDLLYNAGLGGKNAQGFGMFDPVK